jgi:hypothetical protein
MKTDREMAIKALTKSSPIGFAASNQAERFLVFQTV